MTIISKKTIATALSAVILSTTIMTSVNVGSAEASMRNHNWRGHYGHHGFNRGAAIGLGILSTLAVISAIQASRNAVPAHVKRRCAQYKEWRQLMENAKENARIQYARGDSRGGDSWLRSARTYAANADRARHDCKRWSADYR